MSLPAAAPDASQLANMKTSSPSSLGKIERKEKKEKGKKCSTYDQLGEHDIQLLHWRHGQRGLHGLQGEAAVIAQAVRDLGVVAAAKAAEDEGDPPAAPLPRGHGRNPPRPSLLGTRSWGERREEAPAAAPQHRAPVPRRGGGIGATHALSTEGKNGDGLHAKYFCSDLTFTVLATLKTARVQKTPLLALCRHRRSGQRGRGTRRCPRTRSPAAGQVLIPRYRCKALQIPAQIPTDFPVLCRSCPSSPITGGGRFGVLQPRAAGCAWWHQGHGPQSEWLSARRPYTAQEALSCKAQKYPIYPWFALKRVPKHPLAAAGWAALFHGKFCLALIR